VLAAFRAQNGKVQASTFVKRCFFPQALAGLLPLASNIEVLKHLEVS
jgi:hypothetical protein